MKFKLTEVSKFLSRLSKRERNLLYLACCAVGISFLFRLVIYPVFSRIKSVGDEIQSKKLEIKKSIQILSYKDRILAEKAKYASYFKNVNSDDEVMTSTLKEVEGLANRSTLSILDMKPFGIKTEKDNTRRALVAVTCEGQMEQVIEFMYNIENSSTLLSIERFQISPKSKESTVAQCSFIIARVII